MGRLTNRAVVRVSPTDPAEDAAAFLQGLLTNDVTGPLPCYAALLSAQGKVLFDLIVWRSGTEMLLDCEVQAAGDLVKRLALYRLRRKLDIMVDPALSVHWQISPRADASPDPRLAALGWRWLSAETEAEAESGAPADAEWLAHRLSLGVPEGREEMGELLWLETGAAELNGVSFTKGCYVGQENTARMNWRQKVNRRLLVVPLERSDEKRRRVAYPELALAVDHLRVEDIAPDLVPEWMGLQAEAP